VCTGGLCLWIYKKWTSFPAMQVLRSHCICFTVTLSGKQVKLHFHFMRFTDTILTAAFEKLQASRLCMYSTKRTMLFSLSSNVDGYYLTLNLYTQNSGGFFGWQNPAIEIECPIPSESEFQVAISFGHNSIHDITHTG